MKIIQILPTIAYGDAVGNDAIALYYAIKKIGYETVIYAENIDNRISNVNIKDVKKMPSLSDKDIVIYHLSIGTELNYQVAKLSAKKILIYHNITPPEFFCGYSSNAEKLSKDGIQGANFLVNYIDYCIADSKFNKNNLQEIGYQCKIDVLPILIPFKDYEKEPSKKIMNRYKDDYINIIFTGRIAPNKKQEDLIRVFYYYNKYINAKSRLILVGSYSGMEKYYNQLREYCKKLKLKNVVFTGHIKFDEILAYYKIADLFLCMSEHEGFCVPLVEAMKFNIPILAYDSSAIAGTLGGAGVLVKNKDEREIAFLINRILEDTSLKEKIVENQIIRLQDFGYEKIEKQFTEYIEKIIKDR